MTNFQMIIIIVFWLIYGMACLYLGRWFERKGIIRTKDFVISILMIIAIMLIAMVLFGCASTTYIELSRSKDNAEQTRDLLLYQKQMGYEEKVNKK